MALPTTTSTVTVTIEGRSFPARLVRPVPTDPGGYPVVAFGHGFGQTAGRYTSTLTAIAARGYVVVATDAHAGPFPSHARFAADLGRSLRWARAAVPGAHPRLAALTGHSMGGGAAVLAAARHADADSVLTLAAAHTRPSAVAAAGALDVPALFVVGSDDRIVPPGRTRQIYAAAAGPARLATIMGGSHCGFADSTSWFGLGCDSGGISRATQLAITQDLLVGWLDATLRQRPCAPVPAGVTVEDR